MNDQNIFVWLKDQTQPNKLSLTDIEKSFDFNYNPTYKFINPQIKSQILSQFLSPFEAKDQDIGNIFKDQITSDYIPPCSIRWVSEKTNYGLFAEEPLTVGAYAGCYTGILRENNHHFEFNHYLYQYPALDEIGRNFVIDATHGNLTRFINHSYLPNLKPIYAYCNGMYHLIFITIKPVQPGEQLCYDYGQPYWNLRGKPEKI